MSLFEKNPKTPPRIKAGHPCQNCPHSHMDHGYYDPRLCYISDCQCPGLKLDVKPIFPPR